MFLSFLGLLTVDPANGTEFETKFTLKAEENGGWFDPDADDVMFEAGVVNSNGKEVPSGERQASKEFQNIQLKQGIMIIHLSRFLVLKLLIFNSNLEF